MPFNLLSRIKYKLIKLLIKRDLNFYLNLNDIISLEVLADGSYQKDICNAITSCTVSTKKNLLVDIGANIGLISLQTNSHFDKIICIEPNKTVSNILKTNFEINNIDNFILHEFALSPHGNEGVLFSPFTNVGGSFLIAGNMYPDHDSRMRNCNSKIINIVHPDIFFIELFETYKEHNIVFKIDIEGLEYDIVKSILENNCDSNKISIIYENWLDNCKFINIFNNYKKNFSLRNINKSNYLYNEN